MRPRKLVVALLRSETEASLWRLLLETRGPYRVLVATTDAAEALDTLRAFPGCSLVLLQAPLLDEHPDAAAAARHLVGLAALLRVIPKLHVVAFDGLGMRPAELDAEAWEPRGPALAARVLARLRLGALRKRGPAPQRERTWLEQRQALALAAREAQPRKVA